MNLRRKIEADPRRPTRLITVYGQEVRAAMHVFEQLTPAQYPAWPPRQREQDVELDGRALGEFPGKAHLVPVRIDPQCADLDGRAGRRDRTTGSAQHRAHPRHEFARAERLGEIETEQHVVLGGSRGEQDDRDTVVAAELPADLQPVDLGHHHVQHDQRRAAALDAVERVPAVAHDLDVETLTFEVQPHERGLLLVVVGDEDMLAHPPTTPWSLIPLHAPIGVHCLRRVTIGSWPRSGRSRRHRSPWPPRTPAPAGRGAVRPEYGLGVVHG